MRLKNACAAGVLASFLASAVLAQTNASSPQAEPPIRAGDTSMTCQQMADEAAELSAGMGASPGGSSVLGSLGAVARSGAALLIPGAGLALAGADLATKDGRDRRQAGQQADQNRWHYLNGLYSGRGCNAGQRQAGVAPVPPAPPPPRVTPGAPLS